MSRLPPSILRRGLLCALLVAAACVSGAQAQRAIFIVRHAEKVDESKDAALSAAGTRRAEALASFLREAGVTAIYTTEFQRTTQTARPLAQALKIEPVSVTLPGIELATRLRRDHADSVVLVVGHSNTVPELLEALGHKEAVTIDQGDYSNLFVVVPRSSAAPLVLRLRY